MMGRVHFIQCASTDHCCFSHFFKQLSLSVSATVTAIAARHGWQYNFHPLGCLLGKPHRRAGEPELTQSHIQTVIDIRSL